MLRRTHEETLFGLPILKLPDIDENTLVIRFSHVEKLLYREIIKFVMQQYMHISEYTVPYTRTSACMLLLTNYYF